jgi:phenylalanyl-tRNA synthetase beta chain
LSWLEEYVRVEIGPSELADTLTMAGFEVESVADRFAFLETFRIGRVTAVMQHPNAPSLNLCRVDAGDRQVTVVCGAPDVREGMLAPLALPGAVFPDGTVLAETVIRGVTSEGMLCSEAELGLGPEAGRLFEIRSPSAPGENLSRVVSSSDPVFEISVTPNRPDCLSVLGIAREVAALTGKSVRYPDFSMPPDTGDPASITIDAPDHCPRYAARVLDSISVGPSPHWLQDRLRGVGLRPINNIVDITNFVMLETGQPLHAFDYDLLSGKKIVVRLARPDELFMTLDQKERRLSPRTLLICDAEKPVGIAGVMGGLNSEIRGKTTRVLIESAYFAPGSIRRTSKFLGLATDASHRFERGVDPRGTVSALNRAARLMCQMAGGKPLGGLADVHPKPVEATPIGLSVRETNQILGTGLTRAEIAEILDALAFSAEVKTDDTLSVLPPSYRVDVTRPVDLMEEVARLWGYRNIPTTFPLIPARAASPSRAFSFRSGVKQMMAGFGFAEAINYSFIHPLSCDRLDLAADDRRRNQIEILNPLSDEQKVMRTSLIPGLLETMRRNFFQQVRNVRIFETGKVFIGTGGDDLPDEIEMLAGLWTGSRNEVSWHAKETPCDFYDLKGAVESLLTGLHIGAARFQRLPEALCRYTRPGHSARILLGDEVLGLLGEVHPRVIRNFDLKQAAFIFELSLATLFKAASAIPELAPIPRFPAVVRDVTIILDAETESMEILDAIRRTGEERIERMHLFDVFSGDPIPPGKKSVSVRIVYRSATGTLEDGEVNRIHQGITGRLLKELGTPPLPA